MPRRGTIKHENAFVSCFVLLCLGALVVIFRIAQNTAQGGNEIGMKESQRAAAPVDYDANPDRFRTASAVPWKYGSGDVHDPVAERIARENLEPVLDVGCGEGRLVSRLRQRGVWVVAFDFSPTMLAAVDGARARGDARILPFPNGAFKSVAALYMLYHLDDPRLALAESQRVLCPGGLFATVTPSRYNDPELAHVLPAERRSTFDAEIAPALVREFFVDVEVEPWDAPLIHLPDHEAVVTYLIGRGLDPQVCGEVARSLSAPLSLTKRGCLIYGYRAQGKLHGQKNTLEQSV
jgi:SAM-dependent methyltransferase